MNNKINEGKSITSLNSLNENNLSNKSLNLEMKQIIQDLKYFKNDLLLDVRKIEERFNYKLLEQSIISSEQYDSFEKRLSELSDRISQINQIILDYGDISGRIKTLLKFKMETEDSINRIYAQLFTFQKQNKEFSNNIDKIISENLEYPGIIGKNSKFLNFRYFIDYTLQNLKDLNEFMDNTKTFNFHEFRRKINSEIADFRFSLSDNYNNSVRLIGKNFKEFDAKVEDLIKTNNKNMEDNEARFEELKNNIFKYFAEYQTKFENLEKNINENYNQQIKEIDNIKKVKQELKEDINNFKSYLDNIKTSNIDVNDKINNNNGHNFNNENRNNFQSDENDNQTLTSNDKRYKMVMNGNNLENINIIDYYQNCENKNNKEHSPNEKFNEDNNSKISDKNISLTHDDIKKHEEKKESDSHYNTTYKEIKRNNYSITNIANIKIKKVILPEYISKRNIKRKVNSSLSENKGSMLLSNNQSSTLQQKSFYNNDNSNTMRQSVFNLSKINRQKIRKYKTINISQSMKLNNPKVEKNNPDKLKSLITIKSKSNTFKKERKNSLSFEKRKILKDEEAQIGFRKTFNLKKKIKDIILINSRNFKKNRKIKI